MRRPLLNLSTSKQTSLKTTVNSPKLNVELQGVALEKKLRTKRSEAYTQCMTKLDTGSAVVNRAKVDEIIQTIATEFPELKPYQFPIGIVAKCYLGDSYEVHVLDSGLRIVKHYKFGEPLPSGMEKARRLANHSAYAYIEVYSDSICAVAHSGAVSMIKDDPSASPDGGHSY